MPRQNVESAQHGAEWIAQYAANLLRVAPDLQPLDAVRRAMEASTRATGPELDEPQSALFAVEAVTSNMAPKPLWRDWPR